MEHVNPEMRLRVKSDTFYVPHLAGGVYFHNNDGAFWMEGQGIELWLEKLLPLFNGSISLRELTSDLPEAHQRRIYEIAEVLYENGFATDATDEPSHSLSEPALRRFSSQIALVQNLTGIGPARFETYRGTKTVVVADGESLGPLVTALLESGLEEISAVVFQEGVHTQSEIQSSLTEFATSGLEARVDVQSGERMSKVAWNSLIGGADVVVSTLPMSQLDALMRLEKACQERGKPLITGVRMSGIGIVGPVGTDTPLRWESMWRRIHQSAVQCQGHEEINQGPPLGILVNLMAFELFTKRTGIVKDNQRQPQFYLLNMETLEGEWHEFQPHPLVDALFLQDFLKLNNDRGEGIPSLLSDDPPDGSSTQMHLLSVFENLTDSISGILHRWDEGDLKQLPLAACRVQAVDPTSHGHATLLPQRICCSTGHEEARREAGLVGLEQYVARLAVPVLAKPLGSLVSVRRLDADAPNSTDVFKYHDEYVGVGVGASPLEALARGLRRCAVEELRQSVGSAVFLLHSVQLDVSKDETCKFYMESLGTLGTVPSFYVGPEVASLPSVWIRSRHGYVGSVGLTVTDAVKTLLERALLERMEDQRPDTAFESDWIVDAVASQTEMGSGVEQAILVPGGAPLTHETVLSVVRSLAAGGQSVGVVDLAGEAFLRENFGAVYGVVLHEEVHS